MAQQAKQQDKAGEKMGERPETWEPNVLAETHNTLPS
jgi:hypothetical protein